MDIKNKFNRFKSYEDIAKIDGYIEGLPFEKENYKYLLGGYRLNPKVMCCFFSNGRICHTPHNRGFVVELLSGEVTIVGKECVKKLGADEKLLQDVKVLEKEESRQDKIESLQSRLKSPLITFDEVEKTYDRVLALENEIKAFWREIPSYIAHYLQDKVRTDNNAIRANMEYEREYFVKGEKKVNVEIERAVLYRIKGLRFLNTDLIKPVKSRLSSVKGAVKAINSINSNTPQKKLNEIANELNSYSRYLKSIGEFEEYKKEFMNNDFRFFVLLASLVDDKRSFYSFLSSYSEDVEKLGGKRVYQKVKESILNHSGGVRFYILSY
ncbi:hypothetical protein [Halomonas sp. GD1P12]|uniref:hypothetical protein n=1 Tax=Halomonas sp. GD1P12 TaxID=2982691 RepID=UPI0021E5043D|nr:hypothetical protein [Halomonas sp. GD1P12]UYG00924.1 hypothetical protein OCT39_04985 [Halomonas sp. GD1P12]